MLIRDATRDDLPAIVAIYNASIPGRTATADTEPVGVEARESWLEAHDSTLLPLWVVVEDRALVGWLSFQAFYGRPAYRATAEISIYVAPEHQRGGVGRSLLAKAVADAPSLGLKTLVAYVFAHNEASLALLASFGFERWGLMPAIAEIDGVERDLAILGLRLPIAATGASG